MRARPHAMTLSLLRDDRGVAHIQWLYAFILITVFLSFSTATGTGQWKPAWQDAPLGTSLHALLP